MEYIIFITIFIAAPIRETAFFGGYAMHPPQPSPSFDRNFIQNNW